MNLIKYNSGLDLLASLFDHYETQFTEKFSIFPPTDVSECEIDYELSVTAPGLEKSDFNIEINDRKLIISGEKKKLDKKYNFRESAHGKFLRSFTLPNNAAIDEITATYINGILTLKIPKNKQTTNNKVIKVI
jgi:HSP20 family protein